MVRDPRARLFDVVDAADAIGDFVVGWNSTVTCPTECCAKRWSAGWRSAARRSIDSLGRRPILRREFPPSQMWWGCGTCSTLRSDVLDHAGLDGFVYTVEDPLGAPGWGVETTSASLARWGWTLYGGSVLSEASLREMTDFDGEWYGLGSSDFSGDLGTAAVGHGGVSSPTTCCSMIALVALPDEGMVIAVQARTPGTSLSGDSLDDVARLTRSLRDAANE